MTDALTREQIAEYQRKGYLRVRALFNDEEVAAWEAESRRLLTLGLAHADNRTQRGPRRLGECSSANRPPRSSFQTSD